MQKGSRAAGAITTLLHIIYLVTSLSATLAFAESTSPSSKADRPHLASEPQGTPPSDQPAITPKLSPNQRHENHEINVTLFGQVCLLQGPFEPVLLKAIHEISPERLPSTLALLDRDTGTALKKSLAKLASSTGLPSAFDRYRDRLNQRLEAQIAFIEGLQTALKKHQAAALTHSVKPHLRPKNLKTFELAARKLNERTPKKDLDSYLYQLSETYADLIEPDPEEDFHIAARRIGLKYACTYEDSGDEGSEKTSDQPQKKGAPSASE